MVTAPVKRRSTQQGRTLQYDKYGRPFRSEVAQGPDFDLSPAPRNVVPVRSPTLENPGTPEEIAQAFGGPTIFAPGASREQTAAAMANRAAATAGAASPVRPTLSSDELDEIQARVGRQLQPEIDAQARLIGSVRNANPRGRAVVIDGERFLANAGYGPRSTTGVSANRTPLPGSRVGVGRASSGVTTVGTIGSSLMLGPGPGQQEEVVRPSFAYKPGRGPMIGGRQVSQEEFDSAFRARQNLGPPVQVARVPFTEVPGVPVIDDRPGVWSENARREAMMPQTAPDLGLTGIPMPGGGRFVDPMAIAGAAPKAPKGTFVRNAAGSLVPAVKSATGDWVPKGSPGFVDPTVPRFPPGRGGPIYDPAVSPTAPVTQNMASAGSAPAPTAPVNPAAAAAAGGFPWKTAGIGTGVVTIGGIAYLASPDGTPIAPVPVAGPGEDQVYHSRMYGETLDPVVAANRARYENKLASREALVTDRGIGRGERRDIRLGKARADVLAKYGLAGSPEAMAAMYGAQQKAVADQAEPMLMSQVAQRNQIMTALQAQWGVATTPEERARIEQQMQAVNAQPFTTPQGQTPSQFQQSLFPRTPVAPSMTTSVRPKSPAIPPPGTSASGTPTSGETPPPPAPTSAEEVNKITSAATDKAIKEAKENAKKKLVESGKVPWDYDAEVVSVVPFDGSIGIEPAVAFIKSRYPSLTDEQIRQQIRERIKPRGSWYDPNAVFPGLSSP